jgi:hypothetical protein
MEKSQAGFWPKIPKEFVKPFLFLNLFYKLQTHLNSNQA